MKASQASPGGNSELPIGIFDSGLGGLTVVRAIRRELPHEDIVYLGDTARVPYGTKSPSTVVRFSCEDTQFLMHQRVKAVIVGCSTVSAWALPMLEKKFPVPIFGVIEPGVRAALALTKNQRIGIIATNSTIRSMAYTRAITAGCKTARVSVCACPLLVPLVEEGWITHRVTKIILREYLSPLRKQGIDTLILACTHFPLLRETIREVLHNHIALVDCADACATFTRDQLGQLGLLTSTRRRPGRIQAFVTDETERFSKLATHFLGESIDSALQVDLPPL